jgi:hypothetical protein
MCQKQVRGGVEDHRPSGVMSGVASGGTSGVLIRAVGGLDVHGRGLCQSMVKKN